MASPLPLDVGYLFVCEIQHSPVNGCSAVSCSFGVLTGEDERTSLYSTIVHQALECWLNSCGTRASLPHNMWDLPGPGIKPVSLTLLGGFLTTGPPGKPLPASLVPAHLMSLLCTRK